MKTGVASLGMYEHGRQREANDRLWDEIARILRARGIAGVPDGLDRARPVQQGWHDPGLLFGQICGFPLISDPSLALRVLALPVYDAPGCRDGTHCSFLMTRQADAVAIEAYRGRRAAINDIQSNTGMNLFRAMLAGIAGGQRFFASVCETGSHRHSLSALILDEADIVAIDAVTWAAVLRAEPELASSVQIIGTSAASPTPPFVTSRTTPIETVAALRMALADVASDPALSDARDALFLQDIIPGGTDRYASLRLFEIDAAVAGYPELR